MPDGLVRPKIYGDASFIGSTAGTHFGSSAPIFWDASALQWNFGNGVSLVLGGTSQQTISDGDGTTNLIPELQILGTAKADSSLLLASFSATATSVAAPSLNFLKSAHATLGSNTIVVNNEILGEINFFGADGTDFESPGARIHAAVDGTPGVGDLPTELIFSTTPDGSETLAARLTISPAGAFTIAAPTTPASVATTPATAAPSVLTATGGLGGNTTIATTGVGGVGGGTSLTMGAGGTANSAVTAATGGAGGAWVLTTGAGGAAAVAGADATGGAGGAITYASGAGGAVSLAVSGTATGGASGALSLQTGTGGAVTATTGTNVGGASGAVTLASGTGGAASGATDTGGASGAVTVATGTGGAGDTGGASGTLTLRTGAVGAGGAPTAGSLVLATAATTRWTISGIGRHTIAASDTPASVGTTPATAAGAILTVTGGVGGATSIETTGTGGIGGGISVTLGAGGAADSATTAATGGAGGAYSLTTGAGAAAAVAGVDSTGGAGGAVAYTTGAGGAVSLAVSGTATGGASGALSLLTGTGGAVTATTGTNVGGASGAVTFGSGVGGAASGATDTGGASGAVVIRTGTGGAGDTGGASGNLTLQTGAAGSGGSPTTGSIIFSPAAVETARMTGLKVFIGESADANITQGLSINQGASDDVILSLKSSDVAHAATTDAETDSYATFSKSEAAAGGLFITGYKDADGVAGHAVRIRGVLDETAADATRSTAGIGIVSIEACLEGSNTAAVAGANENLLSVGSFTTTRFILDSDGDSHQDVGTAWTAFDDYDDPKLLTALTVGVCRPGDPVREKFAGVLEEYRSELERAKLVTFNADGHHFVNMSRLTMVLTGAVRQLAAKLGAALARLDHAERRLIAAGA